jgi:hypothetical protein
MTSKIKVNTVEAESGTTVTVGQACGSVRTGSNNIQASDGGNLISQSGTTITLGASGDTITLASGASQTGFGRTGTVDWDTTAKTASFTAVSGNGYFVDTSSAAITVTLPASPSAGDIVAVADYTRTFGSNNCTLGRNSQPIGGIANDAVLSTSGQSVTFVYVDSTEGWINVNDAKESTAGTVDFMAATGGTVTTCGDFKVHTFTSPGTFCVSQISTVDSNRNDVAYLVVAGGGGSKSSANGGGAGAGGFREGRNASTVPYTVSPKAAGTGVTVGAQPYPITVGGGGSTDTDGSNSIFSTITSAGGGGGDATPGGSGSGHSHRSSSFGSGNVPPVSPPQGNDGGSGSTPTFSMGGGGGAATAGAAATGGCYSSSGGPGGSGSPTEISGSATTYAGGGGGGGFTQPGGSGGPGGGGAGGPSGSNGSAGTANTGGGAGGAGNSGSGAAGGSGIVIIRYKFQ